MDVSPLLQEIFTNISNCHRWSFYVCLCQYYNNLHMSLSSVFPLHVFSYTLSFLSFHMWGADIYRWFLHRTFNYIDIYSLPMLGSSLTESHWGSLLRIAGCPLHLKIILLWLIERKLRGWGKCGKHLKYSFLSRDSRGDCCYRYTVVAVSWAHISTYLMFAFSAS